MVNTSNHWLVRLAKSTNLLDQAAMRRIPNRNGLIGKVAGEVIGLLYYLVSVR